MIEELLKKPAIVQSVDWPAFSSAGLDVRILREDLRHPVLGGNKIWKLKHNLIGFRQSGKSAIVSFGGAFSNHLLALSEACFLENISLHVVIRGEEKPMNARIARMMRQGTVVHYCSREAYRQRDDMTVLLKTLSDEGCDFGNTADLYLIPEGADNSAGERGCEELARLFPSDCDQVWLACGTGNTLEGLRRGLDKKTEVVGVTVVRNSSVITERMMNMVGHGKTCTVLDGYEEGGYGKRTERLMQFIALFHSHTGIPLDTVYTGKLLHALHTEAEKGMVERGKRIVLLHSGGYA